MANNSLWNRLSRIQGGTNIQSGDLADLVDSNHVAAGTGTLASGTATIATGLNAVTAFHATMIGTGATATGATEVERIVVVSITTGSVVVNGSYHSGTAAVSVQSVSGTGTFYWIAIGTTYA